MTRRHRDGRAQPREQIHKQPLLQQRLVLWTSGLEQSLGVTLVPLEPSPQKKSLCRTRDLVRCHRIVALTTQVGAVAQDLRADNQDRLQMPTASTGMASMLGAEQPVATGLFLLNRPSDWLLAGALMGHAAWRGAAGVRSRLAHVVHVAQTRSPAVQRPRGPQEQLPAGQDQGRDALGELPRPSPQLRLDPDGQGHGPIHGVQDPRTQHDHDRAALHAPGGEPAAGSIEEGFWVISTPEFAQTLRLAPIFVALNLVFTLVGGPGFEPGTPAV